MAKKTAFGLEYGNRLVAVILVKNDELHSLVEEAIREEVSADKEGQFELRFARIGDYGEKTDIKVSYVSNGMLIFDTEFSLIKTISYQKK